MKTNDYPLGSTFEHEGTVLMVAEDRRELGCNDCWFCEKEGCNISNCTAKNRVDGKDVIFVKLAGHE